MSLEIVSEQVMSEALKKKQKGNWKQQLLEEDKFLSWSDFFLAIHLTHVR